MSVKNFYQNIPQAVDQEAFDRIVTGQTVQIERIVSFGQRTPLGEWLQAATDEWVMVLKGNARLCFKRDEKVVAMRPGDYVLIPAGTAHRVEWTDEQEPTVWLAVHFRT